MSSLEGPHPPHPFSCLLVPLEQTDYCLTTSPIPDAPLKAGFWGVLGDMGVRKSSDPKLNLGNGTWGGSAVQTNPDLPG